MFDPTVVGVIGTTLSAFFVGLFGWLGIREKRTREIAETADRSITDLREDLDEQRHRLDIAMVHIYDLRRLIAAHDLTPPTLPTELHPRRTRTDTDGGAPS